MSSYTKYLQQKCNGELKKFSDYDAYITRRNYDRFCCSSNGGTGATGPDGLFGGTSVLYSNPDTQGWVSTTISVPTANNQGIRGNNIIDVNNITEIYACTRDGANTDITDLLAILAEPQAHYKGYIKLMKLGESRTFILFRVETATPVPALPAAANYYTFQGSVIMATTSLPFINGEKIVATITLNGDNTINNVYTNDTNEYYPLILNDSATSTLPQGVTGWTNDSISINPGAGQLSFWYPGITGPAGPTERISTNTSLINAYGPTALALNTFYSPFTFTPATTGMIHIWGLDHIINTGADFPVEKTTYSRLHRRGMYMGTNGASGMNFIGWNNVTGSGSRDVEIKLDANSSRLSMKSWNKTDATGNSSILMEAGDFFGGLRQRSKVTLANSGTGFEVRTNAINNLGFGSRISAIKGPITLSVSGVTGVGGGAGILQSPYIMLQADKNAGVGTHMMLMDARGTKFYEPANNGFEVETSGPTGGIKLYNNTGTNGIDILNTNPDYGINHGVRIRSITPINIGDYTIADGVMHFNNIIYNKALIEVDGDTGQVNIINKTSADKLSLSADNDGGTIFGSTDLKISASNEIFILSDTFVGDSGGITANLSLTDGNKVTSIMSGAGYDTSMFNGDDSQTQIYINSIDNNVYVKNGVGNFGHTGIYKYLAPGSTGFHHVIQIEGLFSTLATGTPILGEPYGFLPAGKVKFGGYEYSNQLGPTGTLYKWQRTDRITFDLTAGSEWNNQVLATGASGPIFLSGIPNAGELVNMKGSVCIEPPAYGGIVNASWNSSLYLGKYGFGTKNISEITRAKNSSFQPTAPGGRTPYVGSGNVYCSNVKQNIVHISPNSAGTTLGNYKTNGGYEGQSTNAKWYNGGDIRHVMVDSTNGNNGYCTVYLPDINNNMLGMQITVTRLFVGQGSTQGIGTGVKAVLIRNASNTRDTINDPVSMTVEKNGQIFVSLDPYNSIPSSIVTFNTHSSYNGNFGSVTFTASQKGWHNDRVQSGIDDYSGDVTSQEYVWVVTGTSYPGK